MLHQDGFFHPRLGATFMRAFDTWHSGWGGYEGYNILYEFVVAFRHLPINTKVNLLKKKNNNNMVVMTIEWCHYYIGSKRCCTANQQDKLHSIEGRILTCSNNQICNFRIYVVTPWVMAIIIYKSIVHFRLSIFLSSYFY